VAKPRTVKTRFKKARALQPDLVLLDVSLPDINGLEISRRLPLNLPHIKILMISQHDPSQLLPGAIEAGADGCLEKRLLGSDHLARIIRERGEI
jgi:DNA-binding NarL/FixJ family response regulator